MIQGTVIAQLKIGVFGEDPRSRSQIRTITDKTNVARKSLSPLAFGGDRRLR